MNQTLEVETTDDEKLNFLKTILPEDHVKSYQETYVDEKGVSYHYYNFVPFCHAYAEFLLVSRSFNLYGAFVGGFNRLIKKDKTHINMKNVQGYRLGKSVISSFFNSNYDKVFIKDRRPPVNGSEFSKESDFESIMVSELKDFFGEEGIFLKRQQKHGYGKSDITINNKLTIELKKSAATRMNVYQTFEYSFDSNLDDVCLLTSSFDEKALAIANRLGISCYTYSFLYEESTEEYPIGFIVEKANVTKVNILDEYLDAMDNTFWISFYDPLFNIDELIQEKTKIVSSIYELSIKKSKENEIETLRFLEQEGYDTSQGLESLIKQLKKEGVAI